MAWASEKFMADLLRVHEGCNGLGIVQVVGVVAKMTNDAPVANQRSCLRCHLND